MAPDPTPALSPSDLVIFGGTGDLASRKILPALYYRLRDGQLPASSRVVIVGRQKLSSAAYLKRARQSCAKFVAKKDFTDTHWKRFAARLTYLALDATKPAQYDALKKLLAQKPRPVRIFYLATAAELFGPICTTLKAKEMVTEETRVVLEKPIGHDLASFRATNKAVLRSFREGQVYRIDHYLGKETVQNLMVLRFGNHIFEKIWNGDVIEHVQITVAEDIGVGERYGYYDSYGALRDMVQNHLLQLLCLVAMEAPPYLSPDAVRDEKLKVLHSLRPITKAEVKADTVRGQYQRSGKTPSYAADIGGRKSDTETFVALKVHVDNWRWSNTPFYLRTGKRLAERYSEIVIQFRAIPHNIFPHMKTFPETNKLIIRLQPDETVNLELNTKVPGPGGYRLKPVQLKMAFSDEFGERIPDAYERLLMDVVRGNPTLFMRSDEVEAAWEWTEHVLTAWKQARMKSEPYTAGSWGPKSAEALLARAKLRWYEQHD